MSICSIQEECGGCPQLRKSLEDQREAKVHWVQRTLSIPVSGITTSPKTEGYRARIELTPNGEGQLSYRSHRSHNPVVVEHCAVARPEINAVLEKLPPVDHSVERIALRSSGTHVVLHAVSRKNKRGHALRWLETLPEIGATLALDGRSIKEPAFTKLRIAGIEHQLSPATFYQVNLEVNALLVADVLTYVQESKSEAILDLFAGAGNFSLPLAAAGIQTTMIEAHPTAAKDARRTSKAHSISVDIRTGRAEDFQAGDAFFDTAILDPPRKGAGTVIDQVLVTRPKAVILVSCNPSTLSGDLKRAHKHGYEMQHIQLYEMFPHTDHVEAMGILTRK
jgi:23S rRNA (uracil1939-C5)-methyltransferase